MVFLFVGNWHRQCEGSYCFPTSCSILTVVHGICLSGYVCTSSTVNELLGGIKRLSSTLIDVEVCVFSSRFGLRFFSFKEELSGLEFTMVLYCV